MDSGVWKTLTPVFLAVRSRTARLRYSLKPTVKRLPSSVCLSLALALSRPLARCFSSLSLFPYLALAFSVSLFSFAFSFSVSLHCLSSRSLSLLSPSFLFVGFNSISHGFVHAHSHSWFCLFNTTCVRHTQTHTNTRVFKHDEQPPVSGGRAAHVSTVTIHHNAGEHNHVQRINE